MKFLVMVLVLCLALVGTGAGCGGSGDSSAGSAGSSVSEESTDAGESTESTGSSASTSPEETTGSAEPAAKKKTKPKVTVPQGISPDKFAIKELEEGTGPSAERGDTVTIQYVIAGYDSKREVDSSWAHAPYTFTLGSGEALKGGELGVEGMKVGGRRELVVPGRLAFGSKGLPPSIAPNETLIMVVDLLAIK